MLENRLNFFVKTLCEGRHFVFHLDGKRSRKSRQRNWLPQGSVLAHTLINIYTNDQPVIGETKSFVYARDLCVAAQSNKFHEVEAHLGEAPEELTPYYVTNHLRTNPAKTQVCVFHLRKKEAEHELNISWNGIPLKHSPKPVYLGVTLHCTLTYKEHILKTKAKVNTRNNVLNKIAKSKWGANKHTIQSTALALYYSVAEYASPV